MPQCPVQNKRRPHSRAPTRRCCLALLPRRLLLAAHGLSRVTIQTMHLLQQLGAHVRGIAIRHPLSHAKPQARS